MFSFNQQAGVGGCLVFVQIFAVFGNNQDAPLAVPTLSALLIAYCQLRLPTSFFPMTNDQ
jgi:hypothetical protein